MLAGVAAGLFRDLAEGARAMVAVHERYRPDPTTSEAYEAAYRTYQDLFEALRPMFATSAGGPTGSLETTA
jgi:ribulose kinase